MIDFIENTEEASKFVAKKLVEVKRILDEIAEETGIVYVAMPEEQIAFIAKVGAQWSSWLIGAHKVISDRLDLSSKHSDWRFTRHPEGAAENHPEDLSSKHSDCMFTRHPEGTAKNHPKKPAQKDLSDDSPSSEERM